MDEKAIEVCNVSKVYKLYDNPKERFKEALGLSSKKKYREHYALDNLSFCVNKGETVGIIGTNGSGKSTILKIITGVLNPTQGEVRVNGRISALLELGAGFNVEYTGLENIYLNGTMIGFSREEIDSKLDDILEFADIGEFVNQPVKTYSSGMFVRLAFAVAINIDPEILIVDEALSVGDVFFQAKCYHKFDEFKKQGKTILFVSHDLSSINKYCDRVVLLNDGVKVGEGPAPEMIDVYKKILVNQHDTGNDKKHLGHSNKQTLIWSEHLDLNPKREVYGNGLAEIIDFGVFDNKNNVTNAIMKGSVFAIKMKVKFNAPIQEPIFAITIKDLKGTDITGTNTMLEHVYFENPNADDIYVASFTQEMHLQGGEYLLSFGCTGYREGEFTVYQRMYDVCNITVISDKDSVGFYDMESEVNVEKMTM